ncbi:MG2 domain-containing protein [uncultured Thiodictyon sp.]|uniref:alpha-2-macroglobulin family protein n=1 Tax=uncultured Thiodictyon sp. TaxID=1846217 RepID=UPI0025E2A05A|nr:MG2 domain-containing protein [uncultured Thiodictyon sp.]
MSHFRRVLLLVFLVMLAACRGQQTVVAPSVYLLNQGAWTPVLVLNFDQEVAPLDELGKPPGHLPQLSPPAAGQWTWQDPSRLVFTPKETTFRPGTRLTVSLQALALREGYRPERSALSYETPALKIVRRQCRWQDILQAPMRRQFEAVVDFNYPVDRPAVTGTLGDNPLPDLASGFGSHLIIHSTALLRPAQDMTLSFQVTPGLVRLLDRDKNGTWTAGAAATLATGADCRLPVLRSAWNTIEDQPAKPPTVTGLRVQLHDGTLQARLDGRDLKESAKKTAAGAEAKNGVTITPAIAGRWVYGDTAAGPDLIFTPTDPTALKPGTDYQIAVAAAAFPGLVFAQAEVIATVQTPPMSGSVTNLQLYSDPADPKIKRVTATLTFSYPPQKDRLAANTAVRLRVEPAKSFNDPRVRSLPFELSYDEKNPRLAYLKTAPITIPDEPGEVSIGVGPGLISSVGGNPSGSAFSNYLAIPSAQDFLRFSAADTQSLIKNDGDIDRLLILQTTSPLQDPHALPKAVEAWLLPDCHEENLARPPLCDDKGIGEWESPEQVDEDTLALSTAVPLSWRDPNQEDKRLHYLVFQAPEKRQVFVKVNHGIASTDGFTLAQDARFLFSLGDNQRELKILHDGALLSLSGSKKLGVAVRGVDRVQVVLQRVLPHNMHHLAQFTRGDFQRPSFKLPIGHFAETFTYEEALPAGNEMQRQYFAVDFARFAKKEGYPPRGLFLLSVAEQKKQPETAAEPCVAPEADAQDNPEVTEETGQAAQTDCAAATAPDEAADAGDGSDQADSAGIKDQRLVLLTDLGLLVKTAADGHQDLFVMSLRSGQPVAGAQVSLLGMNGIPLASAKTDTQGRAVFPSVAGLKNEKTPSVYLAEKDGDLSFLPYARDKRLLDVSRFDIDGLRDAPDSLHAFLFSDRGIYRPGDTAHIGLILRKRDWSALPAGLPLQAVITDPQDQELWRQTIAFGEAGFEELTWTSPAAGKTGTYRVELLLADPAKHAQQETEPKPLGHTLLRVEEFQPDRLQVKTEILGAPGTGWITPDGAKAQVTVRNLFGTAAAGNPAKLEMTVRPWSGQVPGFPDYRFRGGLQTRLAQAPEELGEVNTDAQGVASFDLPLIAIDEPIFEITLAGEGFEKGTGRSVVAVASALVSKQVFLLGQSADGPLDYIAKDSPRRLTLLAVGPDFKPRDTETVTAQVFEQRYLSTLVKREDGLYAYQSVQRDEPRDTLQLVLASGKTDFALPTDNPGRFYVVFKDVHGEELNRVAYSVAGDGNVSRDIERNAELNLTLNKTEYRPGEDIELQIVAPYEGAGLMTIEQDGVIASQWFKTAGTSSTHRITLPSGVSGNGYLSVAFVRSLDSREIYMSPLSAAVVPFAISRQAFVNDIDLNVPETVRPGSNLEVRYTVKDATKVVLYAVDEGILQFAHYRNPAPLDFFFRKRALQTRTHQILDLILPDYALVQQRSSPGGDEDAETFGKYKNPFARKHKPPLAFWSGILDAAPGEHVVSVPVPDYFNGSIRVLAVAVNAGRLAVPVSRSVASNPYVIQPQQPLVVAPGDEFEMGVLVANNSGAAGEQALAVSVTAGEALELRSPNPQTLTLGPGQDGTVRFSARAREQLGPVAVHYQVTGAADATAYSEELSIRPSQPLMTTLQNGVLHITDQQAGKTARLALQRTVYDEQRYAEFSVAMTPVAYLRGMVEYLKNYPYGCTEQLVSQAFPAIVLGSNVELGLSTQDADRLFNRTLQTLQTRLKQDGSFGIWSVGSPTEPFYSMYATHLLLEARERGRKSSDAMFKRAVGYADQYTQQRHYTWHEHQAQAYALYLLARNGQNVADRLRAFEAELARQWGDGGTSANWVRLFLGAAYQIHHLDADADRYFGEFQRQWKRTGLMPWNMQENVQVMSLYLYLLNKHFPGLLDTQDPQFGRYLLELAQDLIKQRGNSFRDSLALLGLGTLWNRFAQDDATSFDIVAGQPLTPLPLHGQTVKRALLERTMNPVQVRGSGMWNLYYQLTERGYDKAPPSVAINQGLTIDRWVLNEQGEPTAELKLQDKLHIRFGLHPDKAMKNIAVVMLIPGGFEIDLSDDGLGSRKSLAIAGKPLWQPEYIDVQEDRVVFFGDLDAGERYFEFRLKPLNSGVYTVPPIMAEGMYDTEILHRGVAGTVRVKE